MHVNKVLCQVQWQSGGRGTGYSVKFIPLRIIFNSVSARLCTKCWAKRKDEKNRCGPRGSLQTQANVRDRCETHRDTYMCRYPSQWIQGFGR